VKLCPGCAHENDDDARFCSQCASPLTEAPTAREERKVVTCLFCDLVGFTARAESMDPEDVRRLLQPYHALVRAELERFGGTVEKFIGDAVMAVFGAPVAHEDDPERAVRAALSIRDALAEEGQLEVRIGITTGEALVALDARPDAGEGMASGDVVNTAARLQTAAPTGAILVDDATFRATERAIVLEEARPVEAKGKSAPIPVWQALRAHARVAVERSGGAALVGRQQELALLRETLTRVVRERAPQLVTLVGVPGIGKSRLVYELFQTIETGDYGFVYWRHGRSLPYGDGVTFWALGEIVKAQAGILESDGVGVAGEKLHRAVGTFVRDDAEAAWLERHLRPLAGVEAQALSAGVVREEAFAAWRLFLEAIADDRPLVLVLEDLHWADDVLLDFVDYLGDWTKGVPLLVLATARPELLARRPTWGGGKVNASTLLISALSEEDTTNLLHALLGRSVLDVDVQSRLLEHAGGNPLYAEEFTRLLVERPDAVVIPETVQGMIAARLDTLPPEEKELLQDAAVVGRSFWLGALGQERWTLEARLHSLERKEFVARQRRSSVAGETEYVIRHALVREVAYEQIPRASRAHKHLAAAGWIESLGRPDDHAEMLAHHYLRALELTRATGGATEDVSARARDVFVDAGDRAASLGSFDVAARFYDEALALGGLEAAVEAAVRYRRGRALHRAALPGAAEALEDARERLLAVGDDEAAAVADATLAEHWWLKGTRARVYEHLTRAYDLVREVDPSPAKAQVLSQVARYRMLAGDDDEAIRIGCEALAMAEELGEPELEAHALNNIGASKHNRGDPDGMSTLERAVEIAVAIRSPEAPRALNNLAWSIAGGGDLRRMGAALDDAIAASERMGTATLALFTRNMRRWQLFRTGAWDEALGPTEEFLAECDAGARHYHEAGMRLRRAGVRLARDDAEGALEDLRKSVPLARALVEPQAVVPGLTGAARLLAEMGELDEARGLARDALAGPPLGWALADLAFVAERLDCADELAEQLDRCTPTRWVAATRSALRGDFSEAARTFEEIGERELESVARERLAAKLLEEGRRSEADEQLRLAASFYRSVGATRYLRRTEELLADASEVSA
jgi:class 3 adenylate cyclase/tetratricopeptide (TPR) repeat protein